MLIIPTIQLTNHMEIKKKKDQSVDAAVLHSGGSTIITGGRRRERERIGGQDRVLEGTRENYRRSVN